MLGGRMGDDVGKKKERGREMKAAQEKKGYVLYSTLKSSR
jgi:hypothetical protein